MYDEIWNVVDTQGNYAYGVHMLMRLPNIEDDAYEVVRLLFMSTIAQSIAEGRFPKDHDYDWDSMFKTMDEACRENADIIFETTGVKMEIQENGTYDPALADVTVYGGDLVGTRDEIEAVALRNQFAC